MLPATPRRPFSEEAPPVVVSNALPRDTMLLCLSFLDVTIHTTLSTVSKDWLALSSEDALWRDHYLNRFSGGSDEGDGETSADEYEDYKQEYKQRLEDPHVGDDVEVAWRGKFRLESLEIYRGTAWWVAVVVDKVALDASSGSPGRGRKIHAAKAWYKVTFPGWEGRWCDLGVPQQFHAIDATRVHLTMKWVVSSSILRPFGPSRATAMLRAGTSGSPEIDYGGARRIRKGPMP